MPEPVSVIITRSGHLAIAGYRVAVSVVTVDEPILLNYLFDLGGNAP